MKKAFDTIVRYIESCTILQQIKPCERLLTNYKAVHQLNDEDGSVIMLNDILKQKEVELNGKFSHYEETCKFY